MENREYAKILLGQVREVLNKKRNLAIAEKSNKIELEPENKGKATSEEVKIMDEKEFQALKDELGAKKTELEATVTKLASAESEVQANASQIEALTTELKTLKDEVEVLRTYKQDKEKEAARTKLLQDRKTKVEESNVDINIESEADKWLDMSDEAFDFILSTFKTWKESKSAQSSIQVPKGVNTPISNENEDDPKKIVRNGLKGLKNS